MIRRWALTALGALALAAGLSAEPAAQPQVRYSYEDRSDTSGYLLTLNGKTFGPFKDLVSTSYSTSGTAAAFAVVKNDKTLVLAQGKESPALPAGFEVDRLQVSDDGKVWVLTATRASSAEDDPSQTLLMVNGKAYGPYPELTSVEYSESGGVWIAAVRTASDEAEVLVSGKPQGPFYTVDHVWVTPDGKSWGYAASDSEGQLSVVTPEKTWKNLEGANFTNLYPREPHWGYSLNISDNEERIFVDGFSYDGFKNFQGLILTPSGRHWAFEVNKHTDTGDVPVVIIDGKEYPGDSLNWSRLGSQESYTWTVRDGDKVNVLTLRLP